MNDSKKLPADVLNAIHAGRKIEAIKLLRQHDGLGLKDAKHMVDAYAMQNRHLIAQPEPGSGTGRLVFIIIILTAAYGAYHFFLAP